MKFINWNSEREKKSFIIKKKIDELDTLINDEKIMEAFKIPLKEVLSYVKEKFNKYPRKKSEECQILINVAYLYKSKQQTVEDIEFIEFIIEKLIRNKDYIAIGLISLHLLFNKYESLDLSSLLKEINKEKSKILKNFIIDGIIKEKDVDMDISFASQISSLLGESLKISKDIPFFYLFKRIMLVFPEFFKNYQDSLLNYLFENKDVLLYHSNLLEIASLLYKNLYDKNHTFFFFLDDQISTCLKEVKNIEKISNFFYLLGNHKNAAHLLRKNKTSILKLINSLKESNRINLLEVFLTSIEIYHLSKDKELLKQIKNGIKFYADTGRYPGLHRVAYNYIEDILNPNYQIKDVSSIFGSIPTDPISELSRLSRRLNIEKERLSKWLDNYHIEEQKYALKILEKLKIVSNEELKDICEKLYKKILEEHNLKDLIFVSIGGEAKSNMYISYHFRLFNEIPEEKFINQLDPKLNEVRDKTIIYLDDISSTGKQLCDDWKNFTKKLKKEFFDTNNFIFTPLFLTIKAKQKIEEKTKFQVIFLEENLLTEKNNVLSEEAKIFESEELRKATEIFSKYGEKLYLKGPLGYGNSGLLLVFPYNTPNNTLPVIWGKSYDINFKWTPLFPRYESKKVRSDKLISDIEVIDEKTKDSIINYLSIQILEENLREKDNIKELDFRIKFSNIKEKTVENVVIIVKAYQLDRSVFLESSECYWNVDTISKTLNPGQDGTIDLLTLKIINNYWHISSSYADDFRFGFTAGPGTIELLINSTKGKSKDYNPIFPANVVFELKITAKDSPPYKIYLLFQIYNCLFTQDISFNFDIYNKEKFLKEIKIQQIVGTLSRSNLRFELEAQHFKLLNELLPEDYEDFLPHYLNRVDKEYHQDILKRLYRIKKFKENIKMDS